MSLQNWTSAHVTQDRVTRDQNVLFNVGSLLILCRYTNLIIRTLSYLFALMVFVPTGRDYYKRITRYVNPLILHIHSILMPTYNAGCTCPTIISTCMAYSKRVLLFTVPFRLFVRPPAHKGSESVQMINSSRIPENAQF